MEIIIFIESIVGIIDGFRWSIIGDSVNLSLTSVVFSTLFAIFFFGTGLRQFRLMEKNFADII